MTSQALAPYSVVAFNAAKLSENKMHDDTVAKRFGFVTRFHKHEIYGVCPDCQKKTKPRR